MSLSDLALPFVRALPPEAAHDATIRALKLGIGLPRINPSQWPLSVTLPKSGLTLANPVGLAAGFDKNAEAMAGMARFGFGVLECGTVTPKPQPGNPRPRLFRLPEDEAVINRMGFNNDGLKAFVRRLKRHRRTATLIGANVGANKISEDFIADYETGITAVHDHCDYIAINVSSPNTPGLRGLQDTDALTRLLTRCQIAYEAVGAKAPVFLKIAPDLTPEDQDEMTATLLSKGQWLAGLIISNTTLARPDTLQGNSRNETGGLSGAPLLEPSTALLKAMAQRLNGAFDLIGCGGISNGTDAYAKLRAGAHAVQLYTALTYHGAGLVTQINTELTALLKADGFNSVAEAVGADLTSP